VTVISVVNPAYETGAVLPAGGLAPRRALTEPAVLTVINNGKPHSRELLTYIVDELALIAPLKSENFFTKPGSAAPIEAAEAERLAAAGGLVLAGVGDCGGCSACSVNDAIQFERLGIPAAVVITEPFVALADGVSRSLGLPGYAPVVLPHPLSSKDDGVLRELAAVAAIEVARRLGDND
jgi:hypothetical protein